VSDLPDVATGSTSYLAYWNAIDQGGVNEIDPTEVTSNGSVSSYTLYDNGLEGTYNLDDGGVSASFRVKNDGWIVVSLPDTDTYQRTENRTQNPDPFEARGHYDVIGWRNEDIETTITNNLLFQAISSLRSSFSNSGAMSFSKSDCGLYNYANESATNTTTFSQQSDPSLGTPSFSYTSNTTLHYGAVTASSWVKDDSYNGNDYKSQMDFEGYTLINTAKTGNKGCADVLGLNLVPDPGTEYQHKHVDYYGDSQNQVTAIFAWS